MFKYYFILTASLSVFAACDNKHKSASEIYNSGLAGNISNFIKIDSDSDTLSDYYKYKYDTALILERIYGSDRSIIRLDAFYYNSLKVGKWILHDFNGDIIGESNYRDNELDGWQIIYNYYNENLVKKKEFYKMGKLQYEIHYTNNDEIADSIYHVN